MAQFVGRWANESPPPLAVVTLIAVGTAVGAGRVPPEIGVAVGWQDRLDTGEPVGDESDQPRPERHHDR